MNMKIEYSGYFWKLHINDAQRTIIEFDSFALASSFMIEIMKSTGSINY